MQHKNSIKRWFIPGAIYFVTTNTKNFTPFFEDDNVAGLLVNTIQFAKIYFKFSLYAYKINPDHIHILLRVPQDYDIAHIIGSIKRNFSRDYNKIYKFNEDKTRNLIYGSNSVGDDSNHRLLPNSNRRLLNHRLKFQWHKSYHDRRIRNRKEFNIYLNYINRQWIKHNLEENKWCYIGDDLILNLPPR